MIPSANYAVASTEMTCPIGLVRVAGRPRDTAQPRPAAQRRAEIRLLQAKLFEPPQFANVQDCCHDRQRLVPVKELLDDIPTVFAHGTHVWTLARAVATTILTAVAIAISVWAAIG